MPRDRSRPYSAFGAVVLEVVRPHAGVRVNVPNMRRQGFGVRRSSPAVLSSSACDEGDDGVGGVPVEVLAAPVVDGGGAWVGVAGGQLHVA